MPEGHTVHRLAAAFRTQFIGQTLRASSPQGRFTEGAAVLDGLRLTGARITNAVMPPSSVRCRG